MPRAAVDFAEGVSGVRTPDHLIALRTHVRTEDRGALRRLHVEIKRFGTTGATDDYVSVFMLQVSSR